MALRREGWVLVTDPALNLLAPFIPFVGAMVFFQLPFSVLEFDVGLWWRLLSHIHFSVKHPFT